MESVITSILRSGICRPDDTAFVWADRNEQKHTVTFGTFAADIRRAVEWLLKRENAAPGAHIGILAKNSYEYMVDILGIIGAGCTAVLFNVENNWDEIRYELLLSELTLLMHDGEYLEMEESLVLEFASLLRPMDGFRACGGMDWIPEQEKDRPAALIYTSGTTGRGKGVLLSANNLRAGIEAYDEILVPYVVDQGSTVMMTCFPLYHVAGLMDSLSWIATGNTTVINLEKRNVLRDLGLFPCAYISVVPMILRSICRFLKRGMKNELASVKHILVSAAVVDAELFELLDQYEIKLLEMYGMSESTGTGLYQFTGRKYDSLGIPMKHTEASIQNGEICLRGGVVMLGYWKNPAADAEAIQDGWLHTGDLGRMDDEGFVYMTGRKKNLIILSTGENVSPEELEGLMLKNENVQEALVWGENDRICAEIFCAEVNRRKVCDFIAKMNETLPFFKRIMRTSFRSEPFAKTASGKIKRG